MNYPNNAPLDPNDPTIQRQRENISRNLNATRGSTQGAVSAALNAHQDALKYAPTSRPGGAAADEDCQPVIVNDVKQEGFTRG